MLLHGREKSFEVDERVKHVVFALITLVSYDISELREGERKNLRKR